MREMTTTESAEVPLFTKWRDVIRKGYLLRRNQQSLRPWEWIWSGRGFGRLQWRKNQVDIMESRHEDLLLAVRDHDIYHREKKQSNQSYYILLLMSKQDSLSGGGEGLEESDGCLRVNGDVKGQRTVYGSFELQKAVLLERGVLSYGQRSCEVQTVNTKQVLLSNRCRWMDLNIISSVTICLKSEGQIQSSIRSK